MTLSQVRNAQKSTKDAKRCTKGSLWVGASLRGPRKLQTHQSPLSSSCAAMVSRTPIPESSTDRSGIRTLTRCSLRTTAKAGAGGTHPPGAEQLLARRHPGCPQHHGRRQPHRVLSGRCHLQDERQSLSLEPQSGQPKTRRGGSQRHGAVSLFPLRPRSLSRCCQASQTPRAAPEPSFCIGTRILFSTPPATTQRALTTSEFPYQTKPGNSPWAGSANCSSALVASELALVRSGGSPRPHLPGDAGGRAQQPPVTHDVGQHEALQVLLEKPVLQHGIGENWRKLCVRAGARSEHPSPLGHSRPGKGVANRAPPRPRLPAKPAAAPARSAHAGGDALQGARRRAAPRELTAVVGSTPQRSRLCPSGGDSHPLGLSSQLPLRFSKGCGFFFQ